jgi:hypothetical protein
MSIRAKTWSYVGKHCFQACTLSRAGKMCQCKFDRKYERNTIENPGDKKKVKNAKSKKAKDNS